MQRCTIALLATAAFLAYGNSASKMAATALATDIGLFTAHANGIRVQRLLRAFETANEDRTGLGTVAGLMQAGTSTIDDIVPAKMLAKYKSLVSNFELVSDIYAALGSSQLKKLNTHIAKVNQNKNPENQLSLIEPLVAKFGDDTVAKTIVELERNADNLAPDLAILMKQLRGEQLTEWRKNGKSGDYVFDLLKLEDEGNSFLLSGKFRLLEDYIKYLKPNNADETLVKVLSTGLGGDGNLVARLQKAKITTRSLSKANELETALLTKWRSENLPPWMVWSRLKFTDNVDEALSSGKLEMFSKYISKYYPNNEGAVLERYITKYDEVAVAKALVTAKNNEATKDFATKLQRQQLEGWVVKHKSADDVFRLLKIKEDGSKALKSRNLEILKDYIKLINVNQDPQDKTNLFRVIRNGFGGDGDFARMLFNAQKTGDLQITMAAKAYESALFKRWVNRQVKPERVNSKVFDGKQGDLENSIVTRYKTYYDDTPQVNRFVNPRQ